VQVNGLITDCHAGRRRNNEQLQVQENSAGQQNYRQQPTLGLMLELWGPRSNSVSKLSRALQCGLLVRTMPYRTTFDRGAVKPSPRPQSVASMRFLESGVQTGLTGVAVSVCQVCLFRSAQIHYVNPPGTSFFATERELILRLAKLQDSGRSTSGHSFLL
jgi:hypothetical protein